MGEKYNFDFNEVLEEYKSGKIYQYTFNILQILEKLFIQQIL